MARVPIRQRQRCRDYRGFAVAKPSADLAQTGPSVYARPADRLQRLRRLFRVVTVVAVLDEMAEVRRPFAVNAEKDGGRCRNPRRCESLRVRDLEAFRVDDQYPALVHPHMSGGRIGLRGRQPVEICSSVSETVQITTGQGDVANEVPVRGARSDRCHRPNLASTTSRLANQLSWPLVAHDDREEVCMEAFIRQLTGVRLVAAAWVMLYHFQLPLDTVHLLLPGVSDVLKIGRLGVDLFFALSGFILTHTYLTKLGPRVRLNASARFWWLRLARIYPVHFVTLQMAWIVALIQPATDAAAGDAGGGKDWLNPVDYIKQLLLLQEWGANPSRGWNFVAWSLSMEWLAYLIFPLLIWALWRFHRAIPTKALLGLWVVAVLPLTVLAATRQNDPYYLLDWASTVRILTEFTAGAITYLIVLRCIREGEEQPRPRVERLATTLSFAMPLLVVVGAIVLGHTASLQWPGLTGYPPPRMHLLLVPPLIVWIGALSLSRRGVARGLSTRTLVLGGYISFSLYMTHRFVYGFWRTGMRIIGIKGGVLYFVGVLGLVALCLLGAYAMWRWIEEPAREWMRRLIGERAKPVAEPTFGAPAP